jgi:hypothetical protein
VQVLAVLGEVVERNAGRNSLEVQSAVAAVLTFLAGLSNEKGGAAAISMKASPYLTRLERLAERS